MPRTVTYDVDRNFCFLHACSTSAMLYIHIFIFNETLLDHAMHENWETYLFNLKLLKVGMMSLQLKTAHFSRKPWS